MPIGNLMAFLAYLMQILFSVMMATMVLVMVPRAAASAERINDGPGRRARHPRPGGPRAGPAPDARHRRVPRRRVRLPGRRRAGAPRHLVHGPAGADHGDRRLHRLGQVDPGQPGAAALRRHRRARSSSTGSTCASGRAPSLWASMGLVPQKAFLFSGTVADNLRFGAPDATEEQMWQALEIAQGADFVRDAARGPRRPDRAGRGERLRRAAAAAGHRPGAGP